MREGFLKRIIECSSELFSNDDKEIKDMDELCFVDICIITNPSNSSTNF